MAPPLLDCLRLPLLQPPMPSPSRRSGRSTSLRLGTSFRVPARGILTTLMSSELPSRRRNFQLPDIRRDRPEVEDADIAEAIKTLQKATGDKTIPKGQSEVISDYLVLTATETDFTQNRLVRRPPFERLAKALHSRAPQVGPSPTVLERRVRRRASILAAVSSQR